MDTFFILSSIFFVCLSIIGSIFFKTVPKEKLAKKITPFTYKLGKIISNLCNNRIGKEATKEMEEGIIASFVYAIKKACDSFLIGLLEDNNQ